jgi:hypothetical protein
MGAVPAEAVDAIFDSQDRHPAVEHAVREMLRGERGELPADAAMPATVLLRLLLSAAAARVQTVGRVTLKGGRVDGPLNLTGFRLDFGVRFERVELVEMILTDLRILALELEGGSAERITAGRLEVAHDLVISRGFTCGRVWMPSVSIGGDMNFGGARLVKARQGEPSLLFDGAHVGNRVFLSRGFEANHGVYGRNARIAGGLLCKSAEFDDDLDLTRAQVQGAVRLGSARVGGALRLAATHVSHDLDLSDTRLDGSVAVLTRLRVDGSLTWKIRRKAARPLRVHLDQARVGFLDDDLKAWDRTLIDLQGFSFDGVAIDASDDDWIGLRIGWLERQRPPWSAQPYDQLRRALRDSGYDGAAVRVAIARETQRRRRGRPSWLQRVWSLTYGAAMAHGYRPAQLFLVAFAVVIVCAVYFAGLDACAPGAKECVDFALPGTDAPPYRPLQFSLDALVPVDLGQTSAWKPTGAVAASVVTFEVIAGWLFTGILVGAVTGLLRRD